MTYIPAGLKRLVIARANNCCEYCRLSQKNNPFPFHIEHIIAQKHRGETIAENLAWSCQDCNRFKGSNIGSLDPQTNTHIPLYHPRTQTWDEHFAIDYQTARIEGLTSEGRATVELLRLNSKEQVESRIGLIAIEEYPC